MYRLLVAFLWIMPVYASSSDSGDESDAAHRCPTCTYDTRERFADSPLGVPVRRCQSCFVIAENAQAARENAKKAAELTARLAALEAAVAKGKQERPEQRTSGQPSHFKGWQQPWFEVRKQEVSEAKRPALADEEWVLDDSKEMSEEVKATVTRMADIQKRIDAQGALKYLVLDDGELQLDSTELSLSTKATLWAMINARTRAEEQEHPTPALRPLATQKVTDDDMQDIQEERRRAQEAMISRTAVLKKPNGQ